MSDIALVLLARPKNMVASTREVKERERIFHPDGQADTQTDGQTDGRTDIGRANAKATRVWLATRT